MPPRYLRTAKQLGGVLLWAVAAACEPTGAPTPPAPTPTAPDHEAMLTVDLVWEGAPGSADPLVLENNLGFSITLEEGYLVSHGLGLVPCATNDRTMSTPPRTGSVWRRLQRWLTPGAARAGHAGDEDVPRFAGSYVERLHRPDRTPMGVLHIPGDRYCETHYLIARAQDPMHGEPDGRSLARQTLFLRGTWRAPTDGLAPTPFQVLSPLANGALDPLKTSVTEAGEPLTLGPARPTLHLEVRRRIPDLFHGVDFPTMRPRDVARQVLKNVVHGTTVREVAP